MHKTSQKPQAEQGKNQQRLCLREFEKRLNEDRSLAEYGKEGRVQPKAKRVSLSKDPASRAIRVRLKRTELAPLKKTVMGEKFIRTYRRARTDHIERLVRVNFEELVRQGVKVLVSVLKERYGERGDASALLDYNTSRDFASFCLNPESGHGFDRSRFITTEGKKMKTGEGAIDYMVRQFFEDEATAKKVWAIACFKFFRSRQKGGKGRQ
ncbi:MAG: hypothetical protein N3E51_01765 [Candidatus Micrarchaeota archaeon]|nr:hypothetical protein [Candidatus Micrarchaeota archaeon]